MSALDDLPKALRDYILHLITKDSEIRQAIAAAVREEEERSKRFPRS